MVSSNVKNTKVATVSVLSVEKAKRLKKKEVIEPVRVSVKMTQIESENLSTLQEEFYLKSKCEAMRKVLRMYELLLRKLTKGLDLKRSYPLDSGGRREELLDVRYVDRSRGETLPPQRFGLEVSGTRALSYIKRELDIEDDATACRQALKVVFPLWYFREYEGSIFTISGRSVGGSEEREDIDIFNQAI